MVDEEGRITLHYAAATNTAQPRVQRASHEIINHLMEANSDGVSLVDPVTGLYPFMLASGPNITASFSLLLANPNLVDCSAQTDVADSRKRKRGDLG